jgi:hypothetical protein
LNDFADWGRRTGKNQNKTKRKDGNKQLPSFFGMQNRDA